MRVRAGAMVQCALCHNAPATVFCFNDNALLCTGCDAQNSQDEQVDMATPECTCARCAREIRGTRWCSARKIRCVDVLTFRFEHPRALGGLAHPASRAHSGCYRVFRRGEEEDSRPTFGSPGDTRPSALRRVISRSVLIRRSIQCADELFLTRFFPRFPQTQAYLCQQCDVSIHKVNSIAGNHERRAVGPFTEEQLAGSGGSGSLGDEQFLELLESGAGGDAFVGLPDISEDGGLWDPNAADSGAFLADVKIEAGDDQGGRSNPKDKNARERQRRRRRRAPNRIAGQPRQRGSGGGGGRAGSSQASGAVVGGRGASVDEATGEFASRRRRRRRFRAEHGRLRAAGPHG